MSQNEITKLELQLKLSQFGLNPKEWILRSTSNFTYLISHKSDQGFKFRGQWKKPLQQKAAWHSLQLLSI